MENFKRYMTDIYAHQETLYTFLENDINTVVANNYDFSSSVFQTNKADVKMLLQANQWLFWKVWEHLESFNIGSDEEPIVSALKTDGIYVQEAFFNADEVSKLLKDWKESMQEVPELTEELSKKTLVNRFVFEPKDKFNYVQGSIYDAKTRVLYNPSTFIPSVMQEYLYKNKTFNSIVKDYFKLDKEVLPDLIMAEHLVSPVYYRQDEAWHIDNLSDQFKVMVVLEDMSEDDAPFTYIEKTHKADVAYRDRYHKMYATNGIGTQEHNHFEASFTKTKEAKKGILKAGDVVFFDCRIHHTATFAKNGGDRKNMMLYYTSVPTARNKFLLRINSFLNFGLK